MRHRTALLTAIIATLAAAQVSAQTPFRWPAVGAVTESEATVFVWLDSAGSVQIEYGVDPGLANGRRSGAVDATVASDFAVKIQLRDLEPDTRYYYRAVALAGGPLSPIQSFETFPPPGIDAPVNILFGSCQQRRTTDSGPVFNAAAALDGDLFIHLGDWTYPDVRIPLFPTAPGTLRQSYADRYDTTYPFVTRILATTPLAYVWDDHDYWRNNCDGSLPAPLKADVLSAYRRYVPHYPLPNADNGIWQSIRIANAEFFLVDSRSQRTPIDSAFTTGGFEPGPRHSMLAGYDVTGVDQRTWLLDAIRRSTARWKIIASPVFFNPTARQIINLAELIGQRQVSREMADKWVGYPADVDSVLSLVAEGRRNLVVISGDAHVNAYDDGTRSVLPEFMAANLDITTVRLFDTLESFGFKLWSGIQTGTNNTVGRVRIETEPVHRLIMESFDEQGNLELQLIVADSSTSSVAQPPRAASTGAEIAVDGRNLRLTFARPAGSDIVLTLFDATGAQVLRTTVVPEGRTTLQIPVPPEVAPGVYLAQLNVGDDSASFRVLVGDVGT